jgi:hypothetical protein
LQTRVRRTPPTSWPQPAYFTHFIMGEGTFGEGHYPSCLDPLIETLYRILGAIWIITP